MFNGADNEVTETPTDGEALPAVLRVPELAAFLRVDRKTVYELISSGALPGTRRCGRSVRIHRDTVLRWLAEGHGHSR